MGLLVLICFSYQKVKMQNWIAIFFLFGIILASTGANDFWNTNGTFGSVNGTFGTWGSGNVTWGTWGSGNETWGTWGSGNGTWGTWGSGNDTIGTWGSGNGSGSGT